MLKTAGEDAETKGMENQPPVQVLIVEDDELQAKIIEELLSLGGIGYVSVKDGHAALDRLNRESYNLIISDVSMPGGISGFKLLRTVRSMDETKKIPFIFVTGRRERSDVERAIDSGVDDYIVKPIDNDILMAKVEALITEKGKIFAFSERPAKSAASFRLDFTIDGISEQAIQFLSPIGLPRNFKLKLNAEIFDDIGIAPPNLRVINSTPARHGEAYRIRASLVGLTQKEMSSIRRWTIENQPRTGA